MIDLDFDNINQNFFAGLSWDQNVSEKTGFFSRSQDHDLDLCCLLLDADSKVIDFITPSNRRDKNHRLQIFHTGDHQTGSASLDDEELHINLKSLAHEISHIVFIVETKSNVAFDEVQSPYCHFSDGNTFKKFLSVDLSEYTPEIDELSRIVDMQFVVCKLSRVLGDKIDRDDWQLLKIAKFVKKDPLGTGGDMAPVLSII